MGSEHRERLQGLLTRRDDLKQKKQRVEGRLEAAKEAQRKVEQECRDRGLDPDKIEEAIVKVELRYEQAVEQLEKDMMGAEQALAPFLREIA